MDDAGALVRNSVVGGLAPGVIKRGAVDALFFDVTLELWEELENE